MLAYLAQPNKIQKRQDASLFTEPIVCEQVFSRKALNYLWSRRDDFKPATATSPGTAVILNSIKNNRKKGSIDGSMRITYALKKTGANKLGFGRIYGSIGAMETLERECRGTLCEPFYYDIDMKNAHPVILVQFAKRYYNVDLKEVAKYCDNRDAYLRQISENRDEAKDAIIRVFYNGQNEYPFLRALQEEVQAFTKNHLMTDTLYEKLLAYVKKQDKNTYGSFLSLILQTEERRIMLTMITTLKNSGWKTDVLAYDGVMIRKNLDLTFDEKLLRCTEQYIHENTGYKVELVNKKFDVFELPAEEIGEVDFKVSKELYQQRKAEFEENHFYFAPTNTIAEVNGENISFYEIPHAKMLFIKYDFTHSAIVIKDRTPFVDLWLHDNDRRTITKIDQKPSEDPLTYSPPVIFRYSQYEHEDEEVIKLFLELAHILSGKSQPLTDYLINWTAHILQKPFENPKTAIILTGGKGCGKDTYGDFISEWVIGEKYYHNYTSTAQFWEKHDCDRMGKFFIKLEEASGALNRQHVGDMKARITSHNMTINPKGIGSTTSANYNRFFMSSNEAKPVAVEEGERRFIVMPSAPDWIGDHAKWDEIRNKLFNVWGGAAIGNYLETLDISNFDPRKLPVNEYQDHIIESEQTAETRFIKQWDGAECTATELFSLYKDYCVENDLSYVRSAQTMGHRLCVFIRDKVISKKHTKTGAIYFKEQV